MAEKSTRQAETQPEVLTPGGGQLAFELDSPEEKASQRRLRRARRHMTEAVSENQWLLPLVGVVLGLLLALGLGLAGGDPDPDRWTISVAETRSGLLSALSILFAGLSIVLALASVTVQNVVGRFSLRLLRIYLRNPWDKAVIAAFALAATFILAEIFRLRTLPPDALAPVGGVVIAVLLLFFSGAMIVWYIGALTGWLRVDRTLRRISRLTLNAARAVEKAHREDAAAAGSSFERPPDGISLPAPSSGYVTDVDTEGLLDLALRYDVQFAIERGPGRSVVQGEPMGWIAAGQSPSDGPPLDQVADMIGISEERELDRAVGYGLVMMVDMAIMALSPAVNDPNTAVQVIEQMTFLFPQLAQVRLGPFGRTDVEGVQRVAVRAPAFGDFVEIATAQIVLYSGGDPAVIRALGHFASVLEGLDLSGHDREAVDTFAARVRGLTTEMPEA